MSYQNSVKNEIMESFYIIFRKFIHNSNFTSATRDQKLH